MDETKQEDSLWKIVAGYAYVLICVFDFVVMPLYQMYSNNEFTKELMVIIPKEDNKYILDTIEKITRSKWEPATVFGGGLVFHLAFGAILTGAAITDKKWTLTSHAGTGLATGTATPPEPENKPTKGKGGK